MADWKQERFTYFDWHDDTPADRWKLWLYSQQIASEHLKLIYGGKPWDFTGLYEMSRNDFNMRLELALDP